MKKVSLYSIIFTILLISFTGYVLLDTFIISEVYETVIPIMCLDDLMKLANEHDFKFIHSSSEPEWATAFLVYSNMVIP